MVIDMTSIRTFKLAGLICQFVNFRNNSPFDNWVWKLDPYQCKYTDEPDFIITENKNNIDIVHPGIILAEEKNGFYVDRLYQMENDLYRWQYEDVKSEDVFLAYDISITEDKITLVCDNTETGGTLAIEYLGKIIIPYFIKHNVIAFHSVLMEYLGQGIMIAAPSGTGKTTHARMWRDEMNALIINGDKAFVKKEEQKWYGYGLPWSGTSGEQINRKIPIKAFVILERGDYNDTQRLDGMDAFGAVLSHLQVPIWNQTLSEQAIDMMMDMLGEVPIIRLICTPDLEAVEVLRKALEEL